MLLRHHLVLLWQEVLALLLHLRGRLLLVAHLLHLALVVDWLGVLW